MSRTTLNLTRSSLFILASAVVALAHAQPVGPVFQNEISQNQRPDEAVATRCDRDGNAIVVGTSEVILVNGARDRDVVVRKLSPSGQIIWHRRLDGGLARFDEAKCADVDADGNVLVAATTLASDGSLDFLTIKIRPDGSLAWLRRHNPGAADASPKAVKATILGAGVVVAGHYAGNSGSVALVHYDSQGQVRFDRTWRPTASTSASPVALGFDTSGFLFVVGNADIPGRGKDIFVAKFNQTTGAQAWTRVVNGAGNGDDVASDGAAAVFSVGVTGRTVVAGGGQRLFVLKVRQSDGSIQWQSTPSFLQNIVSAGTHLRYDASGGFLVAGMGFFSGTGQDMVVAQYRADGSVGFIRNVFGFGISSEIPAGIEADPFGNVYVGGTTLAPSLPTQPVAPKLLVAKMSISGTGLWAQTFDFGLNPGDRVAAFALDRQGGNLYASGGTGLNASDDIHTIGLTQAPEAVDNMFVMSAGETMSVAAPGFLQGDRYLRGARVTLVQAPRNGQVDIRPDGSFRYRPNPGFRGTDSFTYRLSKTGVDFDTATETIRVN